MKWKIGDVRASSEHMLLTKGDYALRLLIEVVVSTYSLRRTC